jgi:hypothetical protein
VVPRLLGGISRAAAFAAVVSRRRFADRGMRHLALRPASALARSGARGGGTLAARAARRGSGRPEHLRPGAGRRRRPPRAPAIAGRDLAPDREPLTDEQLADLDRLRAGLAELTALDPQAGPDSLDRVLGRLGGATGIEPGDEPRVSDATERDSTLVALADQVCTARRSLLGRSA